MVRALRLGQARGTSSAARTDLEFQQFLTKLVIGLGYVKTLSGPSDVTRTG